MLRPEQEECLHFPCTRSGRAVHQWITRLGMQKVPVSIPSILRLGTERFMSRTLQSCWWSLLIKLDPGGQPFKFSVPGPFVRCQVAEIPSSKGPKVEKLATPKLDGPIWHAWLLWFCKVMKESSNYTMSVKKCLEKKVMAGVWGRTSSECWKGKFCYYISTPRWAADYQQLY